MRDDFTVAVTYEEIIGKTDHNKIDPDGADSTLTEGPKELLSVYQGRTPRDGMLEMTSSSSGATLTTLNHCIYPDRIAVIRLLTSGWIDVE